MVPTWEFWAATSTVAVLGNLGIQATWRQNLLMWELPSLV